MRLFFYMLLLSNGIFFVINMLSEPDVSEKQTRFDLSAPQLVLLSELPLVKSTPKIEEKKEESPKIEAKKAVEKEAEAKPKQVAEVKKMTKVKDEGGETEAIPKPKEAVAKVKPKEEKIIKQIAKEEAKPTKKEPSPKVENTNEATVDLTTWMAKFNAENELPAEPKTTIEKEPKLKKEEALAFKQCLTAGPFLKATSLAKMEKFIAKFDANISQRSAERKKVIGTLVYIPSQKNRQAVDQVIKALSAKGVRDYRLLNEPGKSNALSLGVYGQEKNAQDRKRIIEKLNFNVKTETRYLTKTVYWLDYTLSQQQQAVQSEVELKKYKLKQKQINCKS